MARQSLEVVQREGLERIVVSSLSKLGIVICPWIILLLLYGVAAISHQIWGRPPAVIWTTMAGTFITMVLTGLTWLVTHHRQNLGRIHSTLTTLGAGMWFVVANAAGVWNLVVGGMVFFGGGGLALGWNIRAVIRQTPGEEANEDPLRALFDKAKAKVGLDGATITTKEITPYKATAEISVPDGKTVDDLQKKIAALEAAAQVPPGAFAMASNTNNAGRAHFTGTDPRIMNEPIPWTGPSRPGRSIAEPLQIGRFQDSEPVEPIIIGNNLQIMGASGSGKSIGGAWNLQGEAITRYDEATFGIDLSKGDQTLGPLRPALFGFATKLSQAIALIDALHDEIPKRTEWLTDHGYSDWEEGCGLTYWLVHAEEVAKLFDLLPNASQEKFEQIAKEIRSAGGRLILSLQKSIFSEMPTIVRSQMAFMCFGLNDSADAAYGLSEAQQRLEVSPEMWGAGKPEHQGKAYIDAVGIPETHIAIPLRTFSWGSKSKATEAMRAHAEQWPAKAKVVDEFTARVAAVCGVQATVGDVAAQAPACTPAAPARTEPPSAAVDAPTSAQVPTEDADTSLDELLVTAAELVIAAQYATTDMLQRKLRLPHTMCLRLLEILERKEIVGPHIEGKNRDVLVKAEDADRVLAELRDEGDPVAEHIRTPDPDPTITAGPYDEIREPTEAENEMETEPQAPVRKVPPEESRRMVERWIVDLHAKGELSFSATDPELRAIWKATGNESRNWPYTVLERIIRTGAIVKDTSGTGTVYRIVDLEPLGGVPA